MFEYIQFYTKNLSNFTILLLIGVVIAILDITIRNVVRDVYLNVRENMRRGREGMKTKASSKKRTGGGGGDEDGSGGGGGDEDGSGDGENEDCPKDCNAVVALRKKLTGLIENAAKLQNDIQQNNKKIESQQKIIENMQKSVQKLVEKSK